MFGRRNVLTGFVAAAVTALLVQASAAEEKSITVFAAASLKNALDDVDSLFSKQSGIKIVASYAASSSLMKQIEQGAPADVFLSADIDWMDYGIKHNLIKNDTRKDLLGNRLVLIAPKDSKIGSVTIAPGFDLAALAGSGRIATGDVRAVPAGLYAKAALEKLGIWSSVESKIAMAENVRAALVLVARGEAPLGIVYQTDAKVDPSVKIVGVFPEDFTPSDHLSGGHDQGCEARRRAISRVSDHTRGESGVRAIRLSRVGEAYAVNRMSAKKVTAILRAELQGLGAVSALH